MVAKNERPLTAAGISDRRVGTAGADDSYGLVANTIGPVKIGGVSHPATPAPIVLGSAFSDVVLDLLQVALTTPNFI